MKKADFLIIAAAAIVLVGGSFFQSGGERVSVYVDGKLYKTVPLGKPTEIVVATEYGNNTVKVDKDGVRVIDADCPDQVCVHQGTRSHGPTPIVCLPHHLSIRLSEKNADDDSLDAVAGQ